MASVSDLFDMLDAIRVTDEPVEDSSFASGDLHLFPPMVSLSDLGVVCQWTNALVGRYASATL